MRALTHLEDMLRAVVQDRGLTWPEKAKLEPPTNKDFGDLAANLPLVLAGQAKLKPRDLAEELKADCLARDPMLASVEVAGPGFLNFTYAPAFWRETVKDVFAAGETYGQSDLGKGKRVQVEFVSANPTGPLHIGHGRGAATGDAIARVLAATGHEVEKEYYLNDAGRQMRLLGASVLRRAQQVQDPERPFLDEGYKGEYIVDIARDALTKYPSLLTMDEAEAVELCKVLAVDEILAGIKQDLTDFGVTHDVWYSEKSLVDAGKVEQTIERMREAGHAFDADGATWFKTTELGDDKDRVLRKSDGSLTYYASDIAYHDDKYRRGFDLVINVWGADHHGYIGRMKAAVEALGRDREDLQIVLVQLVNLLRGGEQIAMSTRAGEFETLADVVKETGADAARFIFLSRKPDSKLDFDLELVKQKTMDNPVYYVQYAHARIASLYRKAEEREVSLPTSLAEVGDEAEALLARLDTPEDLNICKCLERFPEAIVSAAHSYSAHHVSYYLMELAGLTHRYYTVHPVLAAETTELAQARALLLSAVARVLANGLALLGVSAPERM